MGKWNIKKICTLSLLGILVIIGVEFEGKRYTNATQYNRLIKDTNRYIEDSEYDKAITALFQQSLIYKSDDNIENSIKLVQCLTEVSKVYDESNNITIKSAEDLVRELVMKDSSLNTICEFDHEETINGASYFVVHVYDVVVDHTSTWGWYYVNENNGKVFDGTLGGLTPMN